jgi:hypothetical protein
MQRGQIETLLSQGQQMLLFGQHRRASRAVPSKRRPCQVSRQALQVVITTCFTLGWLCPAVRCSRSLSGQVEIADQGGAGVDQNALVNAFQAHRFGGQRQTDFPSPIAQPEIPIYALAASLPRRIHIPGQADLAAIFSGSAPLGWLGSACPRPRAGQSSCTPARMAEIIQPALRKPRLLSAAPGAGSLRATDENALLCPGSEDALGRRNGAVSLVVSSARTRKRAWRRRVPPRTP